MRRVKGPIWPYLVLGLLTISLLSSCATWKVAKEEVVKPAGKLVIATGPHLAEAILKDIFGWIGYSSDTVEGLIAPTTPSPAPTTP